LIPVLATTGESPEVVGLDEDVEGWVDDGLDPADLAWEPDEQALSDMTAASSSATGVDPPRNRVRTTLPINIHSDAEQTGVGA
jgi:hypothetical protein